MGTYTSDNMAPAATGGKKQKKKWSKGQGQGQPRRRSRQDHHRQALQGCAVVPPHHSRSPRRQIKDQRLARTTGTQGSRGEGSDQEGCCAQQDAGLHESRWRYRLSVSRIERTKSWRSWSNMRKDFDVD